MKVLIVGHVKTGTTALYTIIKAAMPQAHGAFEPRHLGFEAAHRHLVTKYVHLRTYKGAAETYDKRVVIVRDGFDSLISWLFFAPSLKRGFSDDEKVRGYLQQIDMLRAGQAGFKDLDALFQQISGRSGAAQISQQQQLLCAIHDDLGSNCHLLRYEDLIAGRLESLADYLGLDLQASHKPLPHLGERVARSRKAENWKRCFSRQDVRHFEPCYNEFHSRYGYSLSADDLLPRAITKAESSDFVLARINGFRKAKHLPLVGERPNGFAGGAAFEKALVAFNREADKNRSLEQIQTAIAAQSDVVGYHLLHSRILASQKRLPEARAAMDRALLLCSSERRPALLGAKAKLAG